MLVDFDQTLTATEVFNLGRFGEVGLSGVGRLYAVAAVVMPGAAAEAQRDGEQPQPDHPRRRQQPAGHRPDAVPAGRAVGVEHAARRRHAARPDGRHGLPVLGLPDPAGRADPFTRTNPRTPAPDAVGGNLRVASFNVLNFFNGNGARAAASRPRAARTRCSSSTGSGQGGQRAHGHERRHRRADGDRERRRPEQRARGSRRRAERRDRRRHVRVHRHGRDRHRRDQGRADLQAGRGHAGRRLEDHHLGGRPALHRHAEPAVAGADLPAQRDRARSSPSSSTT